MDKPTTAENCPRDGHTNTQILKSIRNTLWLIVSILLIQMGFNLEGFRETNFAQVISILGLWAGFFLLLFTVARFLPNPFAMPDSGSPSPKKEGSSDDEKRAN